MTAAVVRQVGVVGPGRMGSLIALSYAFAGLRSTLVDLRERSAEQARARRDAAFATVDSALGFLSDQGVAPPQALQRARERLHWAGSAEADAALAAADLVVEAVAESVHEKSAVLARVDAAVGDRCIIGSTTSTIGPDELAALVSHPERYLNIHWINPPHLSPLVELQPCRYTDPGLVSALRELHETMGKVPIVCGPSPGYLMPRLQVALMNEAARMVEEGVAEPADIDRALRWGLGLRYAHMGVLEFVDWGGAEILLNAGRYLAGALQAERFEPPALVAHMVAQGRQGLRTGRGFYDWTTRDAAAAQREVQQRIVAMLRAADRLPRAGVLDP